MSHGSHRLHDPFGYMRKALTRTLLLKLESLELDSTGSRVLDFGCGTQPYRSFLPQGCEYIGADLPGNPLADVPILDSKVDVPDASVDLVLSTQVLEHVPDPARYLAECRRVLREGGRLLLSTHGTMFYHPHPTDFWRWTSDGLALTLERAQLTVESMTPLVGAVPTAIWLVMMNFQWRFPWGLRHAFVIACTLAMRLTDRPGVSRVFASDFVYVVIARRSQEAVPAATGEPAT